MTCEFSCKYSSVICLWRVDYKKRWPIMYFRSLEPWRWWGRMPWPTPLFVAAACWPDSREQPSMNTKYVVDRVLYEKKNPNLVFTFIGTRSVSSYWNFSDTQLPRTWKELAHTLWACPPGSPNGEYIKRFFQTRVYAFTKFWMQAEKELRCSGRFMLILWVPWAWQRVSHCWNFFLENNPK